MEARQVDRGGNRNRSGNDGWAWDELRRLCVFFARHYVRSPSDVEDIAQDALLRAWRRRSTLRDPACLKQWLGVIVRNEAFREHARNRPAPVDTAELQRGIDDERMLAAPERADVHAAVERLSERDRQLVHLRYVLDLTQTAIANRLGIPEGTVKVRLHRVRAKLRREIGFI